MERKLSTDSEIIAASGRAMAGGAGTGLAGWFAGINWIGAVGSLIAVVGLGVNVYFQIRRDARETREHEARLAQWEARAHADGNP